MKSILRHLAKNAETRCPADAGDRPYRLRPLSSSAIRCARMNAVPDRAAYEDFFALWKNADPDVPILAQAKAEYAKLQW